MTEMLFVMGKVFPVVFLAGLALFPVTGFEDALLRTAAGVLACGAIFRGLVVPIYRRLKPPVLRLSGLIDQAFEDSHRGALAADALPRIEEHLHALDGKVEDVLETVGAVKHWQDGYDARASLR